jgi:hypothetical protein
MSSQKKAKTNSLVFAHELAKGEYSYADDGSRKGHLRRRACYDRYEDRAGWALFGLLSKETFVLEFLLKGKHARKEVMAFIPCLIKKFKRRSKSFIIHVIVSI